MPAIYSAISNNGLDFAVEPAAALARKAARDRLRGGAPSRHVPSYAPRSKTSARVSRVEHDGLTFIRRDDVSIDGDRRWLGGAVSDERR